MSSGILFLKLAASHFTDEGSEAREHTQGYVAQGLRWGLVQVSPAHFTTSLHYKSTENGGGLAKATEPLSNSH